MSRNEEDRPATNGTASNSERAAQNDTTAFVEALHRRRAASWRCPPLPDGRRDPHAYRQPARWSAAALDAWAATVLHLAGHGHDVVWAVPAEVIDELKRAA